MPRRTDLNHVLVIGSGPIVIGQACEFDYSGTQACRVLRAEGLQVSLVNSNPATIMTDPEYADHTYVEPITAAFVEKVIAQQAERGNKIDALLATLGGQTALNTAVALYENGALERHGVELIGADFDAIQRGEDRQMFKDIVAKVGGESARSRVCFTFDEVRETVEEVGLPVVVRRDVDNDGRIPVGVRGLRRDQRAAGWVKPGNVLRVVSPEELCVTADLLRSPFVTQPPVQVALQLAQQSWPWTWGITGSTGYALATGIPVIHADSDLDLLIRAPQTQ